MSYDEVRPTNIASPSTAGYPVIGENIEGLRDYLVRKNKLPSADAFTRVRDDAIRIIRGCVSFNSPDTQRVGLVVGYVQSGKTLSMTAVSALARDNGCKVVILLAGVTNLLLGQSARRFREDLRGAAGKATSWKIFNSADDFGPTQLTALQQAIADWRDPVFRDDQQTLLYVVLKNHAHLDQLHTLVSGVDLRGVPCLIIDDEADQAGLNTAPDAPEPSTTYQKITRVRNAIPHHTYLQYTATPQAPLLIALDDMLSPSFAELVEPGDGYTGGQAFFGPGAPTARVVAIPEDDLFSPGAPPDSPPISLLAALRVFFVGCAVAAMRSGPTPRSMLVHPSQRTSDHRRYVGWIDAAIKRWTSALRSHDPVDRQDAVNELRFGYDELAKTDSNLPPFDDALINRLLVAIARASLKEVNSQDGSEIDWENAEEHILVGGEKLNRGFTVEGLTVTYMPRDSGGWNADTIQQRARFFGYKASYLSLCRLYLHPEVISAFRSYVRHEEDIRSQLEAHRGRPLREWRRAFFLDARMRPTRANVLRDPYYKYSRDKVWFTQRYPQEADTNRNLALLESVEKSLGYETEDDFWGHEIAETSLQLVYENLLWSFDVRGSDVPGWYAQLVTIGDIVSDNPDARVLMIRMLGDKGSRVRFRSPGKKHEITLHQGPSSAKIGKRYPGDKDLRAPGIVTIQVNRIAIEEPFAPNGDGIPSLAIHIPVALRRDDVGAQVPD